MKRRLPAAVCSLLIGVLAAPLAALAGQPSTDELNRKLEALMDRVKDLESSPRPAAAAEKPKESWADKVRPSGDARVRFENIEKQESLDRERARFRLRLGLDAQVNDEVALKVRLATSATTDADGKEAGADPVSTNQSMDNFETKKPIWVDIMQASYKPAAVPGLELRGGKMANPFYQVGGSDLVWDGDLTPEGAALLYSPKVGDLELMANAGGFYIDERKADRDGGVFGVQGAVKINVADKKAYLLGGASYYDYVHTEGFEVYDFAYDGGSYGNTANGALYQFDYDELELFAEAGCSLEFWGQKLPVAVFGTMVRNQDNAAEDADTDEAYLLGFNVGQTKDPGSWSLGYNYRKVEKDAVLGAFTDSDSFGGGTNGKGGRYAVNYQVMKNVTASATLFDDRVGIAEGEDDLTYRRLQLDISFKF